ncbi:unnamed protein product (macronuclear) [Paramecium tetraurelia]|uniref:MIR domain-containing protein n=1 Tax=Paramecium tetraurelia TaxID=5888 RepID=A0DTN7_PARTE|nr:uncharacterized protein GSPATT00020085001 [Paramecium tetraurelia]CAK86404.1 unnamed protein product [Paramecium tetraurelia]|eukprot:XP_001453801.1 hypothetical protein (macronuclear) [Paramecium tetraurelia strain d4-2]
MEQKEQLPFKTFQLLQIQCQMNNKFLAGKLQIKQQILRKQIETFQLKYLGDANDPDTHFIIELQDDFQNQFLYYGDIIAIKHFKSQLYVNVNHDQRHDHSGKADVSLMEKPEYFVIQPPEEDSILLLKYLNKKIDDPFRLLSSDNRNYLFSHSQKEQNKTLVKAKQKLDVDNKNEGVWKFVYFESDNHILKMFNIVKSQPIFVESGSKIIIRNWWTGFTLHSHTNMVQLGEVQEVTCFSHPRDKNDYWSIVKQQSKNKSKYINREDQIFLQHLQTALYLNVSDEESFSQLGHLVLCSLQVQFFSLQSKFSLLIIAFDEFILEMNKPFTIKFNNYFLAQSPQAAESKIGIQQECIFVENQTPACLWIIEKMI